MELKKELSPQEREELLKALKARFEKNMNRHNGLEWANVQVRLEATTEKLWSLHQTRRSSSPLLRNLSRRIQPSLKKSPRRLVHTTTRSKLYSSRR